MQIKKKLFSIIWRIFFYSFLIILFLGIGRIKLSSIYHNKAIEFFNKNDYKNALSYFKKAISIYPRAYQSHYQLGEIYLKLEKWKMAIDEYKKAISIHTKEPEYYSSLALAYLNAGLTKDAYNIALKATLKWKDNKILSNVLRKICFKYAIELSNSGIDYYFKNDSRDAINNLEKAIEIFPQLSISYINLSYIYQNAGENEKAIDILNQLLKKNPKDYFAYKSIADIYFKNKNYRQAIYNYQKAIDLNPEFVEAYIGIALSYDYLGAYGNALKEIKKANEVSPNNEEILFNLAKIYRDNKNYKKALKIFKKLAQINPDFPSLKESIAEMYKQLGKKEEFKEKANKLIKKGEEDLKKNPDDINALLSIIYNYIEIGNYKKAEGYILSALNRGLESPDIHYFYGEIHEYRKNYKKALKEYEIAKDKSIHSEEIRKRIKEIKDKLNLNPECIVYLKNGRKIKGHLISENENKIIIEVKIGESKGRLIFDNSEIKSIKKILY
jgi:tetratricopeptide (TPR) repeat protein